MPINLNMDFVSLRKFNDGTQAIWKLRKSVDGKTKNKFHDRRITSSKFHDTSARGLQIRQLETKQIIELSIICNDIHRN